MWNGEGSLFERVFKGAQKERKHTQTFFPPRISAKRIWKNKALGVGKLAST